jgi:hypothetical protein
MATLKSRAGAAKLGAPLMVLSFLMVAGFMYWLSVTAEPTEVVVEEPEAVLENVVSFDVFSAGTGEYVGEVVSLEDVFVEALLGYHSFWTNLLDANATSYLLHLSDSLVADTLVSVSRGMVVTVTGTVTVMNDSVLDAWDAADAFRVEVDRTMAEFAENFIEVTLIQLPEPSEPGEADESGSDEGDGG